MIAAHRGGAILKPRGIPLWAYALFSLILSPSLSNIRAAADEPQLTPGAYLRFAGGMSLERPPYPDAWKPDPLRFPYTDAESLYLPPTRPEKAAAAIGPMGLFAPPGNIGRTVRVLVQPGTRSLLVQARGGADFQWRTADGRAQRGSSLSGPVRVERKNGKFSVTPVGGTSVGGGSAVALRIAPLNTETPLELNGKTFRGALEFHAEGAGFLCVNVLSLEDYLRGVVPLEMGRHDETRLEALKAQAVAARTYAVKRALARTAANFDLYASVQDQVYGGAAAEHPMSDRAVRETAGVLLLHGDSLVHAYYHSTCGGMTAARHEMWGGPSIPYLQSRPDLDPQGQPWCKASRYMAWTQEWSDDALAAIVRKNLGEAGVRSAPAFRTITGFDIRSRYADGRINTLEIRTDRGAFSMRGDKTRWALKPAPGTGRILESARFDIEIRAGRVTAKGNGFGHGIGMCQMGALGRAQAGQSYAEILNAYYPGTELAKLSGVK
jgi:stage II sporulation protein D